MSGRPRVTLVPLGSTAARTAWTVTHNGRSYAVFDISGDLRVTDAGCPHNGGPLAEGRVCDGVVTCPWHRYSFDLRTGRCQQAGAGYRLRMYPVVSQGGQRYAEVPDEARPRGLARLLRAYARSARSSGLR